MGEIALLRGIILAHRHPLTYSLLKVTHNRVMANDPYLLVLKRN